MISTRIEWTNEWMNDKTAYLAHVTSTTQGVYRTGIIFLIRSRKLIAFWIWTNAYQNTVFVKNLMTNNFHINRVLKFSNSLDRRYPLKHFTELRFADLIGGHNNKFSAFPCIYVNHKVPTFYHSTLFKLFSKIFYQVSQVQWSWIFLKSVCT